MFCLFIEPTPAIYYYNKIVHLLIICTPNIYTMTEVFGTFILTKNNDRYTGEFFNNKMKSFSNEDVSVLEISSHNIFVGSFDAGWQEAAGNVSAVLEIDLESEEVYILTWKDVRLNGELQNINFTGRGIKRHDLLVCIYSMHNSHP